MLSDYQMTLKMTTFFLIPISHWSNYSVIVVSVIFFLYESTESQDWWPDKLIKLSGRVIEY